MTLRITNTSPGNISALNKWADGIESDIATLKSKIQSTQTTVAKLPTSAAAPVALAGNVTSATVTMGSSTIDGVVYCKVTASYNAPNPLGTFAGVFLVVTGYNGNSTPFKVGEDTFTGAGGGAQSFVTILNRTNETVTFYLVSKNIDEETNDNWTSAPSSSVTLNASNVVGSFTITNGNLTSGVKLGGDSGVTANGASGTLGLGVGPSGTNILQAQGGIISWGSGAIVQTQDRNLTSPIWAIYANGGYGRYWNSTNGDVEYNSGTLKGFYRVPTSFPLETQGQIASAGSSSAYYFYDRNTPTQSNVLYGAGGYGRMQFNGSDMQYWNGSQAGYYRVPATDTLEYQGTSRAYGSGAGVYTTDRSGSPWYAFYGASGYNRIYRSDLGGDTEQSTASLKGFFRTPGTYTLESAGDIYGTAGGTVKIRINNTAASGRHWSIASI